MKRIIALFFVICAAAIIALGLSFEAVQSGGSEEDFLRLHVRANSNSAEDQDIKYIIKQEIVNELTPIFVDVTTKQQAMETLYQNLWRIENVANSVLKNADFDYTAKAYLKTEYFPTRSYNEYSLPEGVYDALIVNLGTAEGDNWWCVVYPPLCFLENNIGGDSGVKYRSKLQEIIKRYF